MNPNKQTIKLAVGVVGVVSWVGLTVRDSRNHQKRMKRLQESSKETRAFVADLEDRVIPALDKQLEKARFWDIVTRDM